MQQPSRETVLKTKYLGFAEPPLFKNTKKLSFDRADSFH